MSEITPEQSAVATLSTYVDRLLDDPVTDELNASENKRRAFFAFVFGGIGGLTIQEGMTAEQAHAVAIGLYCELLRISPMESTGWPRSESTPRPVTRSGRKRRGRDSTSSWPGRRIQRPFYRADFAKCSTMCRRMTRADPRKPGERHERAKSGRVGSAHRRSHGIPVGGAHPTNCGRKVRNRGGGKSMSDTLVASDQPGPDAASTMGQGPVGHTCDRAVGVFP